MVINVGTVDTTNVIFQYIEKLHDFLNHKSLLGHWCIVPCSEMNEYTDGLRFSINFAISSKEAEHCWMAMNEESREGFLFLF